MANEATTNMTDEQHRIRSIELALGFQDKLFDEDQLMILAGRIYRFISGNPTPLQNINIEIKTDDNMKTFIDRMNRAIAKGMSK